MKPHPWLILVIAGAVLGLLLAGLSTYDFVQHLDRQVHSVHCSFIPGLGKQAGESGCQVAMMSPYSSVFRTAVWGGIPISLPAMAVFAFLVLFAIDLALTRRQHDPRATAFFALATVLPAATSILMLAISLTKLGTTCKLCVGIYLASAACLTGAIMTWRRARSAGGLPAKHEREPKAPKPAKRSKQELPDEPAFTGVAPVIPRAASIVAGGSPVGGGVAAGSPAGGGSPEPRRLSAAVEAPATSNGFLAGAFVAGLAFVGLPVLLYLSLAPDHGRYIGTCDALVKPDDIYGVMVRVTADQPAPGAAKVIEILDPLCPACRAFEQRLDASGFSSQLDRSAILFPLDNSCNWMVTEATHPGACAVSEAVLCAAAKDPKGPNSAPAVIAWAFAEQERIRTATTADPEAAARLARERFPDLASCIGSAEARSRLNKSLRWAVSNNIRVLTPQVFVDNVKLCDEDVDLGLEYTLKTMLDRHAAGTLSPIRAEAPPDKPAESAHGDKPTSDKPTGDQLSNDKQTSDKPTSDRPSSDKPSSDKPSSDKPTSDKPTSDKPTSDKPTSEKPTSDKPTSDKPTSDKPFKIPDRRPPEDEPVGTPTPPKPTEPAPPKPAEPAPPKPAEPATQKPAEPAPAKPADKPADQPAGGAP